MASIVERRRKDGTTGFHVRWRDDGLQQSVVAVDAAAAKRIKRLVEAHGTYTEAMAPAGVPTVTEWAEQFLDTSTRANPATVRDYRRSVALHIAPVLGELAISAVTPALVKAWANGLEGKRKTRQNLFALLSGILASAVPEHLPANPCRGIRLRDDPEPDERHLLTPAELRTVLEEIPEHYRPLVATLAATGLRWGEAAALTVADGDLRSDPPVLRVTKAVKHRAGQTDEPGRPKTARSVRRVALPVQLLDVLEPLVTGRPKDAPLFGTINGLRLRNSSFHTLVWQPALDRATDRERHGDQALTHRPRIHDLRGFATTWLIDGGVPIDVVADQLGHESVTTTFNIYRRVNPESGRKAAAAMGAVLSRVLDGPAAVEA